MLGTAIFVIPPMFFSSVVYISQRRSARIKKLILQKLIEVPTDIGFNSFPHPVGHFGTPWQPFLIFEASISLLIKGVLKSKTYLAIVDQSAHAEGCAALH